MQKILKTVDINDIIPYENNPRHNDQAVEAVAESIKQCDYIAPIIVDEDMVILAGHTRHKALRLLGKETVEVMIVKDLTKEQKKKYRLLDNKTNELAEWDFDLLTKELDDLDFGGFDFDFKFGDDWFNSRKKYDNDGDYDEEYDEFLQKFEAKRTTDDCYTPDLVYDAVADWVANEYNLNRKNFVRPFYPGGDYENEKYKADDIVVDNPPFSILAEIVRFYTEHNIKYFLFAPTLTLHSSSSSSSSSCAIPLAVQIIYENAANVNTSFLTNLEDYRVRTAPTLYTAIKEAVDTIRAEQSRELPKYQYPLEVITAPMVAQYSKYGIDFKVAKDESQWISVLDTQKEYGKAIFGGGFLISEKAAAEKAAAEKAKAEKAAAHIWELSDREKEIVKNLGQ